MFEPSRPSSHLFVNREAELAALDDWARGGHPPMSIYGPPGIGKTALLARYAELTRPDYVAQVVLYGRELSSPEVIAALIAQQLRSALGPSISPRPGRNGLLHDLSLGQLKDRRVLITVDELESMPYEQLHPFLRATKEDRSESRWVFAARHFRTGTQVVLDENPRIFLGPLDEVAITALLNHLAPARAAELLEQLHGYADDELDRGNPGLLKQLGNMLLETSDVGHAIGRFAEWLGSDANSLLIALGDSGFKVLPTREESVSRIVTPTGEVLSASPYIVIPRLQRFWVRQIEEFEGLLNDPETKERHYQAFFERHQHFLTGVSYDKVVAQPVLERTEGEGNLRPDFLLRPVGGGRYGDILDLKLPSEKLIVGAKDRRRLSAAIQEAIAQVREYRDYFEQPERRRRVEERYGLTAYRPTVAVVVGRTPELEEEKRRQIYDDVPPHVRVITYDQLLLEMRRLVELFSA